MTAALFSIAHSSAAAAPNAKPAAPKPASDADAFDAGLRRAAKDFEAMFIAEMLRQAKVGEVEGPFSGGFAEETFRSFMTREYASAIADQGGFGLAETLYAQLKEKVSAQ